jgi:hypothetical protein
MRSHPGLTSLAGLVSGLKASKSFFKASLILKKHRKQII